MTVYVDNMHTVSMGRLGRMKMSHMLADSTEELLAMALRIGVHRRYIQHKGEPSEHFDIALSKRTLAVLEGAVEVDMRTMAMMQARRRDSGILGKPEEAAAWFHARLAARRQEKLGDGHAQDHREADGVPVPE